MYLFKPHLINEIGFFVGGTNYVGDVGRTNYIQPNNPGGSILYKYNLNPRIALRGSLSRFSLLGDDAESENAIRQARGFRFKNVVNELKFPIILCALYFSSFILNLLVNI